MLITNSTARLTVVTDRCEKVSADHEEFHTWLKQYLESRESALNEFNESEYWLVPIELMEDAIDILVKGRAHCYCATAFTRATDESEFAVLAIACPSSSKSEG